MYDVVFNNTTLRLCRRATALGPTHLPAEFLGPGGLTHPEQVSLHLVLAYTLSPEFPDQIPGDFRGMNRLLPGLDSQRGTLPLVGARGTVGGGDKGCGQTGHASGHDALYLIEGITGEEPREEPRETGPGPGEDSHNQL